MALSISCSIVTLMGACKQVNQLLIVMKMGAILIRQFFNIHLWLAGNSNVTSSV